MRPVNEAQPGTFGWEIRTSRQELKMMVKDLAAKIEVNPTYITLLESGARRLELNRVPDLEKHLEFASGRLCALWIKQYAPAAYRAIFVDGDIEKMEDL
jgi:predicted transcriptional regulator